VALGSSEEKTEREAQHIPPVDAHFRIRIDQGHPIRPILDSTRFMTDQIGRNARTGRLRFQPRDRDLVMEKEQGRWQLTKGREFTVNKYLRSVSHINLLAAASD